jgi:hypothetical protein
MPYTPPAGNAVNFNFTTTGYGPPPANSIIFNFGGGTGPPFTSPQLPTGLRLAQMPTEDWQWTPRRVFAPPSGLAVLPYVPPRLSGLALAQQGVEPWMPRRRNLVYVPSPSVTTRRPWLFCT